MFTTIFFVLGTVATQHQMPQPSLSLVVPTALRCERRVEPIGAPSRPSLSWKLRAPETAKNVRQTAYQILVASKPSLLESGKGDYWDTKKVLSSESTQIVYAGLPINSWTQVFWKVRIWDQRGQASAWSGVNQWTSGVVKSDDWLANWIQGNAAENAAQKLGATLLARTEFTARPKLKRALVHVSGLGQYVLYLNGKTVGQDILAPGWTNYRKTCLYDSYDVTSTILSGQNAVGIALGSGMYNVVEGRYTKFTGSFGPLKAIVQLELQYLDGTTDLVASGPTWQVTGGPVTFSSPYGGEDFDARLEPVGWKSAGFNAATWTPAVNAPAPGGQLLPTVSSAPPIRAFETIKPAKIRPIKPGTFVYDFGQNASLIPDLLVTGPAGSVVKITPSELIHPDGTVDRRSVGGGEAYWKYTLRGDGQETYKPLFFYHGSRYWQVELSTPEGQKFPVIDRLNAQVIQSDSEQVGTFACSNDLFNRIHVLVRWAQRSNMVSVLSDCPHRERLGWLEQTHLNGPALRYNYGLANFFGKTVDDIADSQLNNGFVPNIAPEFVVFGKNANDVTNPFRNSTEWGASYLLVPWQQYEFEGDLELLKKHYPGMKKYVDWLASQAKGSILNFGLGDWYDIGPRGPGFSQLTPIPYTATAFYYADTLVLANTAKLLGNTTDQAIYEKQAELIKAAINKRFYNSAAHQYGTGSQCANAVGLVMNLAPEADRPAILANLVHDVETKGLTAGDVGYRYLLRALADGGRSDVIYKMNNQSDHPGYGYQLKQGATSLTEAWDANPSSSQNHFMLGQISEWFYHDLAGIQSDPEGPGFKKIIIKPAYSAGPKWVSATYNSPHGMIASHWEWKGSRLGVRVEIPANTTASVYWPGNLPLPKGVKSVRTDGAWKVIALGSGRYSLGS